MSGERRNFQLSRAALVVAAGGTFIGVSQRAVDPGPVATVMLALGGGVVALGLVLAINSFRRSGGAD